MSTLLPSGLIVDLRGLKGRDFRYLADEDVVRDDAVEDFILKNCCHGVTDPGPYDFKNGIDWSKVLVGDAALAFLAIRQICYPDKPFSFPVKCGNRACKLSKRGFTWDVDVAEFMAAKMKSLPEESKQKFKDGNRFETLVPGTQAPCTFKLKTREDGKRFAELLRQRKTGSNKQKSEINPVIFSMAFSMTELANTPKQNGFNQRVTYLEDLEIAQIDELMSIMEAADCGIDTSLIVECPECESERELTLPFDRTFFLPKSGAKKTTTIAAVENDTSDENAI